MQKDNWRDTILAGLANYIDAGSIVAGSVALSLWKADYGLSGNFLGLIGAFGPNAIGAGIGAFIGGRLCDRYGRKTIYQWDMLIYAAGMALLVFASAPWMMVVGFGIVGACGRRGYSGRIGCLTPSRVSTSGSIKCKNRLAVESSFQPTIPVSIKWCGRWESNPHSLRNRILSHLENSITH
jgi:MFS family permease